MRNSIEKIRFLIDDNGRTVWKTFQGKWLAGGMTDMGMPEGHQGKLYTWRVAQAVSGKLVVCRSKVVGPGELTIYETWEAMQPHVPERVFETAQESAGVRAKVEYPEEALAV
jgi:hypothetical protein